MSVTGVKVYLDYGSTAIIGPPDAYERGQLVDIPERPPRYGEPRPGYKTKVRGIASDRLATVVCIKCDGLRYVEEKPCDACPGGGKPPPF